uniref:ZP domain-containing protein n=1 Tax=Leptobrachium leishanense TaxID=445787 RepID=A0A8C5MMT5_9ANUR
MRSSKGFLSIVAILLLGLATQQCLGQIANCSSAYDRYPQNSDLIVTCGSSSIELRIVACPVWYAMFNPANLALNGHHNMSNCMATLDLSVVPPVAKYVFPINDTTTNNCGNSLVIKNTVGTGVFSDFSNVQEVLISGYINTPLASETGLISYSTNLAYNFSCSYPLSYLLNNTGLVSSSANVAINTNNGSFISTLSMKVFTDSGFASPLDFNGPALQLKKTVFVQVAASNLSANFNVFLDHCFATPTPLITTISGDKYDLLLTCRVENKTIIQANGVGKEAKFSFETFRFLQHSSQSTSSIYLHCVTRLCQPDDCARLKQNCQSRRRKRSVDTNSLSTQGTPEAVTVSAGPIQTTDKVSVSTLSSTDPSSVEGTNQLTGTLSGLIVGLVIAAMLGAALVFASVLMFKMYRLRASKDQKNGVDNFAFSGK